MTERHKFWLVFAASLVVACLGVLAPAHTMPLDYDAIIWKSILLAIVWTAIVAVCLTRHSKNGLWLLVGAPLALYWPIWLLFNHFPLCYYAHNCV
jgi:hypothetical protein